MKNVLKVILVGLSVVASNSHAVTTSYEESTDAYLIGDRLDGKTLDQLIKECDEEFEQAVRAFERKNLKIGQSVTLRYSCTEHRLTYVSGH